jgi:branched-chain amino acid transport system ATP-binding protein
MGAEPMVSVRGLTAGYGRVQVLRNVSLDIGAGQFVTVIGANGAGKTTLLKALMGLIPARGDVRLGGENLLGEKAHRRVEMGIAYIPEGRHVFPGLTVEENLRLTATKALKRNGGEHAALDRVYDLFPRLKVRRNQAARSLSGGEQQMLATGRALVLSPTLLIADEVSLGLAPIVVERIFEVLAEMHHQGVAILLAEQNARIALDAADVAYVLETGRITLQGSASELRTDPRVVEAYIQTL